MAVNAESARRDAMPFLCSGCAGDKGAPIATHVNIGPPHSNLVVSLTLCEECGRDVANAIGFMCVKDGGWSKLEPRKRKAKR